MKHFLPQERIAKECSCLLWHSRLNFLDPLQSECKIFFHRNFLLTAKFITMDTHGTSEYTIAYNKNWQFDATTSEYANEKELFRPCRRYATLFLAWVGTLPSAAKLCKGPTTIVAVSELVLRIQQRKNWHTYFLTLILRMCSGIVLTYLSPSPSVRTYILTSTQHNPTYFKCNGIYLGICSRMLS